MGYFSSDSSQVGYTSPAGGATRDMQTKAADVCDLRDFAGLDLTGTHDNTSILNQAMTQGGGGEIRAPQGRMVVTSFQWQQSNTHLKGFGRGGTIFEFTASGVAGLSSATKGTSDLLYCRASDIQFLDNGSLSHVVDLSDMQFCQLERCFTYGSGAPGSVGVYLGASNNAGTLQCTYNRVQDHYNGNTQYGIYIHDGANADTIIGGRFQSGVTGAIGIILAPSAAGLVNGNMIIGIGVEQPGNTMTGVQLNGNTSGTTLIGARFESLLNGLVISSTDTGVTRGGLYFSGCTNNIVDASNGAAFVGNSALGFGGPLAQFNYNGSTQTTNKAVNCSISRTSAGVYVISGLPFANANFTPNVSSTQAGTETVINSKSQITVTTLNSSGTATDATIFGSLFE